jgi:hypothetical protein
MFASIQSIEEHVRRIRPDFMISFICVTFGEYLYYLVAKRLGIPFLNIRVTKIDNYVTVAPDIFEPSKNVVGCYNNLDREDISKEISDFADGYLKKLSASRIKYEGQNLIGRRDRGWKRFWNGFFRMPRILLKIGASKLGLVSKPYVENDNHQPNPLIGAFYDQIVKPVRSRFIKKLFSNRFIRLKDLHGQPFAFFPLHIEPEISLFVYSRPYLNQIEVVRWVARSLPTNWKLVLKEHPNKPFYWSKGFYKKIFEIPNVYMVPHETSTYELNQLSKIIFTFASFVGLEALGIGRPVICFGLSPYDCLPPFMYRRIDDPRTIGDETFELIKNFRKEDQYLKRYIAAVVKESERFDWYTLGRSNVKGDRERLDDFLNDPNYREQFINFSKYLAGKIKSEISNLEDREMNHTMVER